MRGHLLVLAHNAVEPPEKALASLQWLPVPVVEFAPCCHQPASLTGEPSHSTSDGGMLRLKRKRLVGSRRSLSVTKRCQSSVE